MSPEYIHRARVIAIEGFLATIDPHGRINASGRGIPNRFPNPFKRDAAIATSQILPEEGNIDLYPVALPAAITTLELFLSKLSDWDLEDLAEGIMPYQVAHEIHDRYSDQNRARELAADRWRHTKDKDGNILINAYEGDDTNAWAVIMADVISTTLEKIGQQDKAQVKLAVWWPYLEASLMRDIFYADREGDGVIKTYPNTRNKITNRTIRDSGNAFIKNGELPRPPYSFFANNVWHTLAQEAGSRLASKIGLDGFAKFLRDRRVRLADQLHERFWWEEEQCYVPLLDGAGQRVEIITNESSVGIFAGVLPREYEAKAARRTLHSDLLTPFGTRTRGIDDPDFAINGELAYHSGIVWPLFDNLLCIGARRAGLRDVVDELRPRLIRVANEIGCEECFAVDLHGQWDHYREGGIPKGCNPHIFTASGLLTLTALSFAELPKAA